MKRLSTWLIIASLLIAVGSASAWAETRYVLITLLHTNDMHGSVAPLDQPGGLARIATLVRGIRSEMPNVLLLDAGDIIHGTPEDYYSCGLATISAMNATGYNLATPGNHEFDFGLDVFKGAMSVACFPFISANIKSATDGQWDKLGACSIVNVDGVRIGIVGLATLETITSHWPGSVKDIRVDDPFAVASAVIPKLRAQSDVVVVLSHLGEAADLRLAQSVPGIDFIIGGHSHTVISTRRTVGPTVIAQAGTQSRSLGRIDFIVKTDESGASVASINGVNGFWNKLPRPPMGRTYPESALIPVDNTIPEDAEVLKAYTPYREATDKLLACVAGRTSGAITGGGVDSPAANLVADAVRCFAGADIAVIDSKSVTKAGLPAGPVQVRHIHDLIGGYTRQQIVVGKIKAGDLMRALQANIAKNNPATLSISGASYSYSGGASPLVSLCVNGRIPEPSVVYTLAAQAYVMMDIMKTVPGIEITAEPRETTREAVVKYFQQKSTVSVPDVGRVKTTKQSSKP